MEESRGQFGSWEEASQVGNKALKQFCSELIRTCSLTRPPARRHVAEDCDLPKPETELPEFRWSQRRADCANLNWSADFKLGRFDLNGYF